MTKDAFIREVRDAEAMLYHISKSILKNDSDCGDAVQETILKAYEKTSHLKERKIFPNMDHKDFDQRMQRDSSEKKKCYSI